MKTIIVIRFRSAIYIEVICRFCSIEYFYSSDSSTFKNAKIFYFSDECWSEVKGSVNLTSFYNQTAELHKEKIQSEIAQIENLISALF